MNSVGVKFNMNTFNQDLDLGEKVESIVLDMIQAKYPNAYKVPGKFKPYDIFVPEKDIKVEVKYDKKSLETGNVFIETSYNGEPSGISTSEADYWVLSDGFHFYWITTSALRSMLPQGKKITTKIAGKYLEGVLLKSPLLWKPKLVS